MTGQTVDLLTVLYNVYFNFKRDSMFNPTKLVNYLSEQLGLKFGDRRYKLKLLAYSGIGMLIQYRGVKYYVEHDYSKGEWIANFYYR